MTQVHFWRKPRYDHSASLTFFDIVNSQVLIGGAPFGFANIPEKLYSEHNVRGVINMCEEYNGPLRKYKELGIEELHLPTTDHFEPELDDLMVRPEMRFAVSDVDPPNSISVM